MAFKSGFYAFYYTGKSGSGHLLLCLAKGRIAGIDPAGGQITGTYEDGDEAVEAICKFQFPAGAELVTGQTLPQAVTVESKFSLSHGFFNGDTERVDIGMGPMNARGVFVSELFD